MQPKLWKLLLKMLVLILLIFRRVAILGEGTGCPVSRVMALDASEPDIRIIAIPDIPGPDDKA